MGAAISIRLPESVLKKLNGVVKETERSKSFHVQKALETYLEDYADLQIALDRLRDVSDGKLSSREMRKKLGL